MVKHELTLDVATYNGKGVFRAKQGDQNSHELDISIVNGGDALDLADVETVILNIKRADELASQFYGEIDGDTVKVVLPHFALAVAGETKMSVSLVNGSSVLTTLTFTIMVEGQEVTDADVAGDGTENVLCSLLCEVKDALTELNGMKDTAAWAKEALENSEKALAETKELSDDLTARVEEDERVVGTMDGRMDTLEKTVQVVLGQDYGDLPGKLHSLDEDRKKVNETLYAEDTGLCDRTEVLEESLQALKDDLYGTEDTDGALETIRKTAESYTDDKVKDETSAREKADSDLDARLDALENADYSALTERLNNLDEAIKDETQARETAVQAVQGDLTDYEEKTDARLDALENADYGELTKRLEDIDKAIETETQERTDADEKLDARVKAIEDDYLTSTDKEAIESSVQAVQDALDDYKESNDEAVEAVKTALTYKMQIADVDALFEEA